MKIVADENIPAVVEAFSSLGEVETVNGRTLTASQLHDADILLVRSVTRVDATLLADTPVRFVASATAGLNHVDLDWLTARDIGFANAPGSNAVSAAEYVIAAICFWSLEKDRPLRELSVGIVGCGNVGSRVKQRCEALGMRCVVNDPPLADQGVSDLVALEPVLDCDIVTLHVPLVEQGPYPTRQLIGDERLAAMRPGSLFINASRGEVLAESELLARLKSTADLDAVLDVWENEPDIDPEMLRHSFLGTAHIAGYSIDGKIRGTEMIYRACCEYFGEQPVWSAANVELPVPKKQLSFSADTDLREAVLEAYDIETDSERLKVVLDTGVENIGQYFDYLRKHYPIRREFTELPDPVC